MSWTFVTNHSQVLRTIAMNPDLRVRDIAEAVGITERAARRIVHDLEDGGYVTHTRVGRRNHYDVHEQRSLRHPLALGVPVGELLQILDQSDR